MTQRQIIYVGLTNDPELRRELHGNPPDFRVVSTFAAEVDARAWLEGTSAELGCTTGTAGVGWRFGYLYTMTPDTKE